MTSKQMYDVMKRQHEIAGRLNFSLEVFGDHLAKKNGYTSHSGIDAIHFYLVEKYHWLPSVVKAISFDDLRFLLSEEMNGWTLPSEAL